MISLAGDFKLLFHGPSGTFFIVVVTKLLNFVNNVSVTLQSLTPKANSHSITSASQTLAMQLFHYFMQIHCLAYSKFLLIYKLFKQVLAHGFKSLLLIHK